MNLKSAIRNSKSAILVGALLLALCSPAEAQQTGKVPRIGLLDPSTAAGSAVLLEAFRQELHKLGWIEGKNITIEYRFAEQKPGRLPELAAELVRLSIINLKAAKQIGLTIPPNVLSFDENRATGIRHWQQ